jgi:hypothetical protein
MEYCSRQCLRRTLYAVLIGVSPIVICLLLIALVRLILHRLEKGYNRRHNPSDRRSSSVFYRSGRPTLSYTPVSSAELQRIIQGDYQSQQQSESSLVNIYTDASSPKDPQREPSSNILANLVIRRDAIDSTPLTALFGPASSSDMTNQQKSRYPNVMTVTHESIETTALAPINNKSSNMNDLSECEQTEMNSSLRSPNTTTTTTTTTTVVVEEFLDFHSVHSIPYSLNLVNTFLENDF